MAVISIAEAFGKLPSEVEDELTPEDLAELIAYFNLKAESRKKEAEKNKGKGKRPTRRR